MSILPDKGIREMVWPSNGTAPSIFVPCDRLDMGEIKELQIQPASLDVRLAREIIRHPSGEFIDMNDEGYSLAPGECILASLVERFRMGADNVVGRIEGKSSWARKFLSIHAAGFIDPGFCGDLTLELKNDGHARITLLPGVRIAQISFQFLAGPVQRMYGHNNLGSHYQYQCGPTESWMNNASHAR